MRIKKSALKNLIYEMLLTESKRAEAWISRIEDEEERLSYQAAYDAGVQIESDLIWIQNVRDGEPVEDIIGDVLEFRKEKVQNALPGYNAPKDLSRYESVGELRRILGQIADVDKQKEDYTIAFQSDEHVTRVDKIGNWEILMPLTRIGSSACDISGKETVWCTTKRKGQNLFYSYVGRKNADIVLFYVMDYSRNPIDPFKRQKEACVENNDARMCVGYFNGYPRLEGEDGGVSVDAANKGLTKKSLKKALGPNYSNIMETMEDFADTIGGKHPAKKVMEKCSENPRLLAFLVKNYGPVETLDFFAGTLEYGVTAQVLDIIFSKCEKFHNKLIKKSTKDYEEFIIKLFEFFEKLPQSNSRKGFGEARNFYCNKIMQEHVFRVINYYEKGYPHSGAAGGYSNHMDASVLESIEMLYDAIIKNADLSHEVMNKIIQYKSKNPRYNFLYNQLLEDSDDIEFISDHVINDLLSGKKSESDALKAYRLVISALKNIHISDTSGFYDPEYLSDTQKQAASRMVSAIFDKYIAEESIQKTGVFKDILSSTEKTFRFGLVKRLAAIQVAPQDMLDKIFSILHDDPRENRYEEKEYDEAIDIFTMNHNLGPQTIQKIIECDDPVLRKELAHNRTDLTFEQFNTLARDPFHDVRRAVAMNTSTPTEVLESLVTANTSISYIMFDNRDGPRSGRLSDQDSKEISKAVVNNPNCSLRAMIRAHQLHRGYVGSLGPKILVNFGVAMMEMPQYKFQKAIIKKLDEYNMSGDQLGAPGVRTFEEIAGDRCDELILELKERFGIPENLEFSRWYRTTHFRESFTWFYSHQEPTQVMQIREGKPGIPLPREVWSYDDVEVVPEISYRAFLDARGQEQSQYRVKRKGQ